MSKKIKNETLSTFREESNEGGTLNHGEILHQSVVEQNVDVKDVLGQEVSEIKSLLQNTVTDTDINENLNEIDGDVQAPIESEAERQTQKEINDEIREQRQKAMAQDLATAAYNAELKRKANNKSKEERIE